MEISTTNVSLLLLVFFSSQERKIRHIFNCQAAPQIKGMPNRQSNRQCKPRLCNIVTHIMNITRPYSWECTGGNSLFFYIYIFNVRPLCRNDSHIYHIERLRKSLLLSIFFETGQWPLETTENH